MRDTRPSEPDTTEFHRWTASETSPTIDPNMQPQAASDGRPLIDRAMSWLVAFLLEGFAAAAVAMHPCVLDLSDNPDTRRDASHPEASSQPRLQRNPWSQQDWSSHEVDIAAWLASAPSRPPRDGFRWFRLTRFWPGRHFAPKERLPSDWLDMADDPTRRETGIEYHGIDNASQDFDPSR